MEIRQNIFLKYQDYMNEYPFVKSFELKCKILSRQHHYEQGCDYFGDRMDSGYAISMKLCRNKVLLIYEGAWKKNSFSGKGVLYTISHPKNVNKMLRVIEADWVDGKPHGKGRIKYYDTSKRQWRTIYEGDFKNGEKWGFGVEQSGDYLYRGYFQKGCRTGSGRLEDSEGNFFDGQFQKNFLTGEAICSIGNAFIISDDDSRNQVYRKPQDLLEFTQKFSKLIHQIVFRQN